VVGEVNVTVRMRGKVTKALGESAPRHCCAPHPIVHATSAAVGSYAQCVHTGIPR